MKKFNKTWLLLLSLGLVFAFCSTALAGAEFKAVNVQTLYPEGMTSLYEGVEVQPAPMPMLKRPSVMPQGPVRHLGPPMELKLEPPKVPTDAYSSKPMEGGVVPQAGTCPPSSYVQYYDFNNTAWLGRIMGVLFYTGIDGLPYKCTASLINRNLILTAGHCVMTSGLIHSGFEFIPGYYYNQRPFNTWNGNTVIYFSYWQNSDDFNYDVAFITLNPNGGHYVGDVVGGWIGFATSGDPSGRTWDQYGYPYNLADGEGLIKVISSFGTYDPYFGLSTIGVGSNMLQGSSGGPWVWWKNTTNIAPYANGLNSYGLSNGCPEAMYSPYFDSIIWDGYQYAKSIQ